MANSIDDLTPRELGIATRKCKVPMQALQDPEAFGLPELMATLAWVHAKRTNPQESWDEWMDSPFSKVDAYFAPDPDESEEGK